MIGVGILSGPYPHVFPTLLLVEEFLQSGVTTPFWSSRVAAKEWGVAFILQRGWLRVVGLILQGPINRYEASARVATL